MVINTALSIEDGLCNLVEVTIKQVYFAGCSLNPGSAIDPGTPFIETGYGRWSHGDGIHNFG